MRWKTVAVAAWAFAMGGCGCGSGGPLSTEALDSASGGHGYDLEGQGAPRLATADFTDPGLLDAVTLYRSGHGRDASDASESCRSLEHHLRPLAGQRVNRAVPLRCPWRGTVVEVKDAGRGASTALDNKEVRLRCDAVPEFTVVFTPVDLVAPGLVAGEALEAGDLLGHARLVFEDLGQTAETYTAAAWCETPAGPRRLSLFRMMTPGAMAAWTARGVASADDLAIPRSARDAAPLACGSDGRFLGPSSLPDWFPLD